MNNFTLLPSANWNMSHMLVVNESGNVCAYGSRGDIIIIKNADKDNYCELDNIIISSAHKYARVMGLVFVKCEIADKMVELLASCGDDGRIKIWDYEKKTATHKVILKDKENPTNPMKFVDIDYFSRSNCIICITEQGCIVKWDLNQNKIWPFNVSLKGSPTCVAVCPHADDLVAIGCQFGRVIVFSVKGEGKLIHRLLCHSSDVTSVSWCPVPYNVLQLSKPSVKGFDAEEFKNTDKTFLLASCCSDLTIYISRAGTDNHCETLIKLPAKPLLNSSSRYATKRGPIVQRGRVLKWIYPLVVVTFTNYNEMISLYLSNFDSKSSIVEDKLSSQSMKVTHLKYDARSLHNAHKRNISCFDVCLFNREEVDFRVWSFSFDKIIVRSGYRKNYKEKSMILPLLSGFIFSMDISQVNPDLLAIGTGDGKISIWNMSSDDVIDVNTLSKKIDHKVMSVSWHPHFEGIFAFGTYEGRVGLFDVSQGKYTPTIFKTLHQKAVYRLCWAPPIYSDKSDEFDIKSKYCDNLYLMAVVDGDILQYNPQKTDELPISLSKVVIFKCDSCSEVNDKLCSCKNKSDMCYEPNRDIIVIGYKAGEVRLFSAKSLELLHTIIDQTKTILSLTWHPETVFDSPNQVSPCRDWLAVAGEKVLVYDIQAGESPPKKIASLDVHSSRVLHVSWSPHMNGRLITGSGDSTAIIWDVLNQSIIGRYTKHNAQILCGMWSRKNRDVVITGSSDFTCRLWSISKDTVSTASVEEKKKNTAVIEPCVVNMLKATENVVAPEKPAAHRSQKNQTLFPSTSNEFSGSVLLDAVFERAIVKRDPNYAKISNGKCPKHDSSFQNDSLTSLEDSFTALELVRGNNSDASPSKSNTPENAGKRMTRKSPVQPQPGRNYSNIFGSKEELVDLICHEERILEESGSNDYLILVQARDTLKAKIKEAIEKNKVTIHHLALAASISPKVYKDACHVYVEQMVHADNICEAVNFQLALGLDVEAVSLLCEKRRFKEAFAVARLRLDDDSLVREVLTKWITFCNSCGSYRLGAHCFMYLNEEEKAGILLSKSKVAKDVLMAARLLRFYQPERALELVTDCFRRNITNFSRQNVEEVFTWFPELKFLGPWYYTFKYFTDEKPSTASITKWVIGILKNKYNIPEDFIDSNDSIDFEKLESAVVYNSFQMTYDELNLYVSAQAALYIIGSTDPNHATGALRHYVRALSMCYNYRILNSNQFYSDKAYPTMRLLKLMFPEGIFEKCETNDFDHASPLCKSINAYVCDFVISWLVSCDDLPISMKALRRPADNETEKSQDALSKDELDLDKEDFPSYPNDIIVTENLESALDIIVNKKVKLEKISLVLSNFLDDLLDLDAINYFKNVSKLKKLDSSYTTKNTIEPTILKNDSNSANALLAASNGVENSLSNCVSKCNGPPDGAGDEANELSNLLSEALTVDDSQNDFKCLKSAVERFENERGSAPNPFVFIIILKVFLAKHKETEFQLVSELENLLGLAIKECGMED